MNRLLFLLNKKVTAQIIRFFIQAFVFVCALFIPVGIFHMICPLGGVVTLSRLLSQGLFVAKTGPANLILLGGVVLFTIFFGAVFCGWLCPLGSIQDWIRSMVSKKISVRTLPKKIDKILSFLRYGVLVFIVWATAQSFNLVFKNADPYYALMHFWTGEVGFLALGVLLIVLVSSIFIQRPWCRWFCPLGGIIGLLAKMSVFKVKIPSSHCVSCGMCKKACPVGLDPSAGKTVTSSRCISCGLCVTACPPKLRTENYGFIRPLVAALLLIGLCIAVPRFIVAENIDEQGVVTSFEVKPQSKIEDILRYTEIPKETLYSLLGLPSEYPLSTQLINIEDDFEDKTWAWIKEVLGETINK